MVPLCSKLYVKLVWYGNDSYELFVACVLEKIEFLKLNQMKINLNSF